MPRVEEGLSRLFQAVVRMRGTLSGEHGIGTSKADFLPLEQQPELIEIQRRIKAVFDPKGLLNPHKIFPRREVAVVAGAGRPVALHGAC
jgi:glycolate oxidase